MSHLIRIDSHLFNEAPTKNGIRPFSVYFIVALVCRLWVIPYFFLGLLKSQSGKLPHLVKRPVKVALFWCYPSRVKYPPIQPVGISPM
jgi:hypothetical protein